MTLRIGETKQNSAFTLIEILLVVVIVGIFLAVAAPNFTKGYSHFQLNKTADDLLSMSRWAQAMAIGQERIYALSFSNDRRSYDLVCAKVPSDNEAIENAEETDDQDNFEPVKGALGRMHNIPVAISLDIVQTSDSKAKGNMNTIEFYPDGTIDPSTIKLSSSQQKTIISSTEVRGMMTKVDDD